MEIVRRNGPHHALTICWALLGLLLGTETTLGETRSVNQPAGGAACTLTTSEIHEKASPAVVSISTRSINPYRLSGRVERAIGSGFLLDKSGLILTNSHVVFGAQSITVTLDDGRSAPAKLVGLDPIFDLAVLKIPVPNNHNLTTLTLAETFVVRVGDDVIAIGNPLGLDQTLTHGVVSALNRVLPETPFSLTRPMIQTDTAINPGNSGGPLLDRCGRVVGVNTAIFQGAQGIGFAVPSKLVAEVLPSLIKYGGIIRPWLGFHGQIVDLNLAKIVKIPLVPGLMVEVVEPESPAAKAKIRGGVIDISIDGEELLVGGDIITEMNGISLDSREALQTAMQGVKVGSKVKLKLFRDGKQITVSYKTPRRPILPSDVHNN